MTLRDASPADAAKLAELWADIVRRGDHVERVADLDVLILRADMDPDMRIVVAEYDGQVAGAVHLQATTLSALNLEPVVQALSPQVFPEFRRKGLGRALMEAAVVFAEEKSIPHIATASTSSSRDANRFMARLAFAPQAVLRLAPTSAVRAKLTAQRPAFARTTTNRPLGQLLAARRSMRRSQVTPS
ncbi:hypothetical protein GCM10027026_32160 [Myroides odoratimimus subsp. xuanwuensis]